MTKSTNAELFKPVTKLIGVFSRAGYSTCTGGNFYDKVFNAKNIKAQADEYYGYQKTAHEVQELLSQGDRGGAVNRLFLLTQAFNDGANALINNPPSILDFSRAASCEVKLDNYRTFVAETETAVNAVLSTFPHAVKKPA